MFGVKSIGTASGKASYDYNAEVVWSLGAGMDFTYMWKLPCNARSQMGLGLMPIVDFNCNKLFSADPVAELSFQYDVNKDLGFSAFYGLGARIYFNSGQTFLLQRLGVGISCFDIDGIHFGLRGGFSVTRNDWDHMGAFGQFVVGVGRK